MQLVSKRSVPLWPSIAQMSTPRLLTLRPKIAQLLRQLVLLSVARGGGQIRAPDRIICRYIMTASPSPSSKLEQGRSDNLILRHDFVYSVSMSLGVVLSARLDMVFPKILREQFKCILSDSNSFHIKYLVRKRIQTIPV